MNRSWIYAGLAALAGVMLTLAWRGEPPAGGEPSSAVAVAGQTTRSPSVTAITGSSVPAGNEIDALRRRLDAEMRARSELENQIESLQQQVEELRNLVISGAASGQQAPDPGDTDGDTANAWFNEQALIASGMDGGLAAELKTFFERIELERLQLRDRAAREGWDRERRRAGLEALDEREQSLRERLGEDGYDAYLYAAGRPNRVAVTSVLASAPAGQAGIQAGDYILRYDNERIYDWRDLRSATTAGNLSEMIEIEVERDGESLRFYLARGPLGVRMDSRSVAP